MFARTTACSGPAAPIDEAVDHVRNNLLPAVLLLPGSVDMSLLADRTIGRCVTTSSWRTLEDRQDGDEQVAPLRARGHAILGTTPEVE